MFMKKLILLLLFIPLVSFGQNDFRKMFWGESKETLKEKYPDVIIIPENINGLESLTHFDNAAGFPASITYMFLENELIGGAYIFNPLGFKGGDDKLKDFNSVSERLNDKYEMERNDTWFKDTYKDDPDDLGYAIDFGDVVLSETGRKDDGKVMIAHTLNKESHTLGFIIEAGTIAIGKSIDDDI